MKRLTILLLTLMLLCALTPAHADRYYDQDGYRLSVNSLGTIFLHEPLDQTLTTYTTPAEIWSIEAEAFEDCRNAKHIVIPEGPYRICESAFIGCDNLETVVIPTSVGFISSQSTRGNQPTFIVPHGSYAYRWCVREGWPYRLPENDDVITQEECVGYWEAELVEWCGVDKTEEYYRWNNTAALIFAEDGQGDSRSIVSIASDPSIHKIFTGNSRPITWWLDNGGNVFVNATWTSTWYDIGENGEHENEREVTESLTFTLYPQGDRLILEHTDSGKTLRISFRKVTSTVTREDFLGEWTAIRMERNGEDITSNFLKYGREIGITFNEDSALFLDTLNDPPVSASDWVFLPNGVAEIDWDMTFHFEGDALVSEQGDTRTYYVRNGAADTSSVSAPTAGDYLGHWTLVKAEFYDTDVTEDLPDIGIRSYTITPGAALHHALSTSQGDDGSWIYEPTDVSCTWSLQPDGSILVVGDERPITLRLEGEYLIGTDGPMTTWFARNDAAPLTAEEYMGHWALARAEMDGMDMTANLVALDQHGVTFNSDHALIHYPSVTVTDGVVTATPTVITCAWVFQPDGSMDVLFGGRTFTFRLCGDTLLMDFGGEHYTYVRAQAPAAAAQAPGTINIADCLGHWTAFQVEYDGEDVTDEYLPLVSVSMTFERGRALLHITDPDSPDGVYTSECAWQLTADDQIELLQDGMSMRLDFTGKLIILRQDELICYFAREEDAGAQSAASPEEAAFLSVFTHPATQTDKELVLISAYAAEKVYRPANIQAYLTGLGFPAERILTYDYTCDAAHYVALTLASREVVNAQGQTVTLYAVIVRGTVDTAEWISNFDMGNDDVATGFNQAALRALAHLADYMELYPPVDGGEPLLWITGHSRGAAVANLIAGQYTALPPEQVYCVTFATPNVARDTHRHTNILNFVIDGDVVTNVPLANWGFDRHGLTVHYSKDQLLDVTLIPVDDMKLLLAFLGSVSQAEYYEMTLEVLHSDVIKARNSVTLTDMLALNVAGVVNAHLDHADGTLLALLNLGGDALINTLFQNEMRLLLGNAMPLENQMTFFALYGVIDTIMTNAAPSHLMTTYVQWIECIYYDRPTTYSVPGSGGGGGR